MIVSHARKRERQAGKEQEQRGASRGATHLPRLGDQSELGLARGFDELGSKDT